MAIAFACAIPASIYQMRYPRSYLELEDQSDFSVYFVGAQLVRHGEGSKLYEYASTVADPQRVDAASQSAMAQMARRDGLQRIRLYVYPPFLADALLPLTILGLDAARAVWRVIALCSLLIGVLSISRLLGLRLRSRASAVVAAGVLCCSPLWQSLHYGQITMVLFALWSLSIVLYVEGRKRAFGVLMAAAVLLKLTPLLVVLPLMLWRDWRAVRWFGGAVFAGLLMMCGINSPGVLWFYVSHVVPPMSRGIAAIDNLTVNSIAGTMWARTGHSGIMPSPLRVLSTVLGAGLVAGVAWLTHRRGRRLSAEMKGVVLASFALLSLCVSPVAWVDAFVLSSILLALLWGRSLREGCTPAELILLFVGTVDLGASVSFQHMHGGSAWLLALQYSPMGASLLLIFLGLAKRRAPLWDAF